MGGSLLLADKIGSGHSMVLGYTIMVASFFKSAAPGIPQKLNETYYQAATIHALLGFATLILLFAPSSQ